MNLNSNIILSGQQPNIVNTLTQSSRAAGITNAVQQQNALAQVNQQHGTGILAGDPNALNALAAVDPQQALQAQQAHRQNALQERRFEFDERRFDFQIKKFEAQATAAQKAEAAAAARKDAFMLGAAQSPEEFDQIAQEIGEPELVGGFEQRDFIVRKHMTAAELLEASKPRVPLSAPGKVQADINAGDLPADTPLRGQGTTINTGDIHQSAANGVVDTSQIEPSDRFNDATRNAVGAAGLATGIINTIGEIAQLGQAAPNVDEAQTALTSLSTTTMLGLSEDFPGRPSNLTRERIEAMTIKPGDLFTGPGRALNKTRDMLGVIQDSIDAANAVLLDPLYSKSDKAKAKTALRRLSQTWADYKNLEQSLSIETSGTNTTKSGVSWEVVE